MKTDFYPFFSVITVCFNAEEGIKITIQSVLDQKCNDFEYLIIDGGSNDNTVDIIKSFEKKFVERGITYKWISALDRGIFDAMNSGIKMSSGRWLNFMNSGDRFCSSDTLKDVLIIARELLDETVIYGYKMQDNIAVYPVSLDSLRNGIIMANHQSMFFNYEVLKGQLSYDLRYPVYADYELVNRIFLRYGERTFKYLNMPIAIYEGGGISEKPSTQKRKDKYFILYRNYGLLGILKGILKKAATSFK